MTTTTAPTTGTYYADTAQRYLDIAQTFPEGSLGRSLNTAEASKYLALSARFDGMPTPRASAECETT